LTLTHARAAKLGIEAANHAAEIKLRAERKAGEMLAQLERKPGQRTDNQPVDTMSTGSEYKEVLDEQEISYRQGARWQELAEIPEETVEAKGLEVLEVTLL